MIKMRAESDSGTFCFKVFRNRVGYYVKEDALVQYRRVSLRSWPVSMAVVLLTCCRILNF